MGRALGAPRVPCAPALLLPLASHSQRRLRADRLRLECPISPPPLPLASHSQRRLRADRSVLCLNAASAAS
eukprot:scaffold27391_cov20-Tisochrysis_lutea.AAC.1